MQTWLNLQDKNHYCHLVAHPALVWRLWMNY